MWRDPHPKPCYLFALVGGNLASYASDFTTASGRKVDLRIYVEPGKEEPLRLGDGLAQALACAGTRSASGASTTSTCSTSSPCRTSTWGRWRTRASTSSTTRLILASPETATDANFAAIERVIAHEYFHNWTGNRITCRDWFQLCLKEGLTVFRDQEFCADQRSATVQRIRDVRNLKAPQFPEDAGPLAHPVRPDRYIEINNFYTATVYEKGAEVVRMIQTLLGREGFRKGMDLYFERHDGQAATVEDFVACFEDATGKDLAAVHDLVLAGRHARARLPAQVRCARPRPPTSRSRRCCRRRRARPKKKPLHIPMRLGLLGGNGQDHRPHAGLRRAPRGRRHRGHQAHRDLPLPRRALAAGAVAAARLLGAGQPDDRPAPTRDLQFLMANDSDLYNRWQAAQDYATRVLVRRGEGPARRQAARASRTAFVAALGVTLGDDEPRPRLPRAVHVPAERERPRPGHRPGRGPARHPQRAQGRCARPSAPRSTMRLLDTYRDYEVKGPYSPAPEAAGKRALRNAALGYLTSRGQPRGHRPRRGAFRQRPQRHRRGERAGDALRAALAGADQGLRPLLRALEGRSPRDRQLVRLPGRLARCRRRSPRSKSSPGTRCSPSRTPTRCAR